MCELNSGSSPRFLRDSDQRVDVLVQLLLLAVVGVQTDIDRVVLRHDASEFGKRDRASDHVLDGRSGGVFRATGGELNNAVRAGLGEALDSGDHGLR